MQYKLLGNSGLRVTELSLGTMTFGENWGWGASREEAHKILDAYLEAGGNFIDTANNYTEGHSEQLVGQFLKGKRDGVVLATKFTGSIAAGDPNGWGNHRKNIRLSLEKSLQALQTDYIDLYWVHIWDFTTRPEEVMRTLDEAVSAGKVLYIGISDAPAWVISQANTFSELRGWTPFTAIQVEYNLLQRTTEFDLLSMAKTFGLGVLAWSPLAAGILTGKFQHQENDSKRAFIQQQGRLTPRTEAVVAEVVGIARHIGKSPSQVALNWLLQQGEQLFPIVGARKLEQVADNLQAVGFRLDQEHLQTLDQVSRPEPVFPYSMWKNRQQMVDFLSKGGGNIANWRMPF